MGKKKLSRIFHSFQCWAVRMVGRITLSEISFIFFSRHSLLSNCPLSQTFNWHFFLSGKLKFVQNILHSNTNLQEHNKRSSNDTLQKCRSGRWFSSINCVVQFSVLLSNLIIRFHVSKNESSWCCFKMLRLQSWKREFTFILFIHGIFFGADKMYNNYHVDVAISNELCEGKQPTLTEMTCLLHVFCVLFSFVQWLITYSDCDCNILDSLNAPFKSDFRVFIKSKLFAAIFSCLIKTFP